MNPNVFHNLLNSGVVNNLANRFFQIAVGFGGLLAIIAEVSGNKEMESYFEPSDLELYVIIIQAVFAVVIFLLGEPTKKNWESADIVAKIKASKYGKKISIDDEKLEEKIGYLKTHFSKYWSFVWGSWAAFYVLLLVKNAFMPEFESWEPVRFSEATLTVIQNFLTNLNSYFILSLYILLVHKFDSTKVTKDRNIDFNKFVNRGLFVLIVITLVEMVIYLCLDMQDSEIVRESFERFSSMFKIVNGILACICFTMMISRLIGSFTTVFPYKNTFILPVLFLYCSIQPLYYFVNTFSEDEAFKITFSTIILFVALFGKYILYIFITMMFETKLILFHFIETHHIREDIDNKVESFNEAFKE